MERAAKSLGKLKASVKLSSEDLAHAAWPAAVGNRIARHTKPLKLVRDRLVVAVEDPIWQKQLFQLRYHILYKLREMLDDDSVRDIEFQIVPPRKPAQSAEALSAAPQSHDEADGVRDPVLRSLYKQSRKKTSA